MPGVDCNFVLTWDEGMRPNLGEGISRTSKDVPLYRVRVRFKGESPLTETVRAADEQEAAKFASNRYPHALAITVIGKA